MFIGGDYEGHPSLRLKNVPLTELQIRESIEDNSEIICLTFNENICCDPSLEPSRQDGSDDGL